MEVHTLEIDSSERDYSKYPDPHDYVIDLKNEIYDVKKITLLSARIPNSQTLLHPRNNTFSINSSIISLPNRSFKDGFDLAQVITDSVTNISASYNSTTNSITYTNIGSNEKVIKFGDGVNARYISGTDDTVSNLVSSNYTTPHQLFGLPPQNITIAANGGTYKGGSVNLEGPNAFLLRIGTGSETFNKDVYLREPFYTGQILINGPYVNYISDDPVEHTFFSGSQKGLKSLHVQFFYMSQGRMIPYDFRHQEHVLKFQIECNTGKFKAISKHTAPEVGVLPPPISIPDFEDPYRWRQYVLISIILFFGVFTLIITRKKV